MTTLDTTHARDYTEASVADTYSVVGAPLITVPSHGGAMLATHLTVRYQWRTQLDHTWWTVGNLDLALVPARPDGQRDESPARSGLTLIKGLDDAPDWVVEQALRWAPADRRLHVPGRRIVPQPTTNPPHEPAPDAPTLERLHTTTTVTHVIYGIRITGATSVITSLPDTDRIRRVLPQDMTLSYRQHPDTLAWTLKEMGITGRFVDTDGEPVGGTGTVSPYLLPDRAPYDALVRELRPDPAVHGLLPVAVPTAI